MKLDRWYVEARDIRHDTNAWSAPIECKTRSDARILRNSLTFEGFMEARILQYEFKGVVG